MLLVSISRVGMLVAVIAVQKRRREEGRRKRKRASGVWGWREPPAAAVTAEPAFWVGEPNDPLFQTSSQSPPV